MACIFTASDLFYRAYSGCASSGKTKTNTCNDSFAVGIQGHFITPQALPELAPDGSPVPCGVGLPPAPGRSPRGPLPAVQRCYAASGLSISALAGTLPGWTTLLPLLFLENLTVVSLL